VSGGPPIPLASPFVGDDEVDEVRRVLASGHLTQGPRVEAFERAVAECTGARHAIATSSCTTALHLSLAALDIGPGDEVLVPDFTFPATANVVVQQGATPVLVDVELESYNVDPNDLSRHLTPRTRAIMPVHLFGLSADMEPILAFADAHGLAVIEDAACALGATYFERPCGTLGDVGCFSFHPRKVVTTGEGGMIVTNRDDLAERIRRLASHGGIRRNDRFTFEDAGFNYRLSDIHAAVGVVQMRRLPNLLRRRRALAAEMRARMDELKGVDAPSEPAWGGHVYQAFVTLLDPIIDRDAVIAGLRAAGVEATLGTYALHAQPVYQRLLGTTSGSLPGSFAAFRRSLALPFYPAMGESELDRVVETLRELVE
jgi:perosamine synthetase